MTTKVDMEAPRQVLPTRRAIDLASKIIECYRLASIEPLLASCFQVSAHDELSVAVAGRFKAGKSSFLNHYLQRELLPVGVIPVTTVVTEIAFGPFEKAAVHFLDGREQEIALNEISQFISEKENPENVKQVSTVKIELPELLRIRHLRFVDMPGLESALAHNSEAALNWLPNVGLALIAVSIDPPLSQHDIDLMKRVYEYTPAVSILLTKVDLVNDSERAEVIVFVRERLSNVFDFVPRIFPYSVKAGYGKLREEFDSILIQKTLAEFAEHRSAVLGRKLETLLYECRAYLTLALKSADTVESEREALRCQIVGEQESLADVKSELGLLVKHTATGTRAAVAKRLEARKSELEKDLLTQLVDEFPRWTSSLRTALESFEQWLREMLAERLLALSAEERVALVAPLEKLKQRIYRSLQNFRDRLSDKTMRAFGVPLRTTESEIEIAEPHTPDIRIGRVFDRNWELLSPVTPMWIIKPFVRRHFTNKAPDIIEKNLSRLASQWDDSLRSAMTQLLKEAEQRFDQLVATVERLVTTSSTDAPGLRSDVELLDALLAEMRNDGSKLDE